MGGARVQEHVSTQLVQLLPRASVLMVVKTTQLAALHQRQAPWGREPEDAALLGTVRGSHNNGNRLVQHGLVAAVRVYIHRRQEACLFGRENETGSK